MLSVQCFPLEITSDSCHEVKNTFFSFFPPFISFFFPRRISSFESRLDLSVTWMCMYSSTLSQLSAAAGQGSTSYQGPGLSWCLAHRSVPFSSCCACPLHQITEYGLNDFWSPQLVCAVALAAQDIDAKDLPVETQTNCFAEQLEIAKTEVGLEFFRCKKLISQPLFSFLLSGKWKQRIFSQVLTSKNILCIVHF